MQFGSLQFKGHCELQEGPQYPSTHPSIHFPEPSHIFPLQATPHPKIQKLF